MEDKNIYREKSLERIKSPINLNQYIKVANPSIWLGLFTVLGIGMGILIWVYILCQPTINL